MFNVTVEQLDLMAALKKVKDTVGKGKDNNYDNFVYMESFVDPSTQSPMLKLVTNNMNEHSDISIKVDFATDGVGPIVEYNKFVKLIGTINDGHQVTLEGADTTTVLIKHQGSKKPIKFNGADNSKFCTIADFKPDTIINVPYAQLAKGLNLAGSVIFDDERYPLYNCVNVTLENQMATFESIDSKYRRMVVFKEPSSHPVDSKFFLEYNKVKKYLSHFDSNKDIEIAISNSLIGFRSDDVKIVSRLINGTFPACSTWIPNQYNCEVEFNQLDMLKVLERAQILAENGNIGFKYATFTISNNIINLKVSSMYGDMDEDIPCTMQGGDVVATFHIDGLYEAIKGVAGGAVTWLFPNSNVSFISYTAGTGDDYKCLVPQVRTKASEVAETTETAQVAETTEENTEEEVA